MQIDLIAINIIYIILVLPNYHNIMKIFHQTKDKLEKI